MGPAIFSFVVAFLLIAGSTQISEPILAIAQGIAGIYYVVAGAIVGWQSTRD